MATSTEPTAPDEQPAEQRHRFADPQAPSIDDLLRDKGISYPWQRKAAREAFAAWLHSWQGLDMTAEELRDRVGGS